MGICKLIKFFLFAQNLGEPTEVSAPIDAADNLNDIAKKLEIHHDIDDCIKTVGADTLQEIFRRFITSGEQFEKVIDHLFGVNSSQFTVAAKIILIKAINNLLEEFPYAKQAVVRLVCDTSPADTILLKRDLEDPHLCEGYVNLYHLVYTTLNCRYEPTFLNKFPLPSRVDLSSSRKTLRSTPKLCEPFMSHLGSISGVE